MRDDDIYKRVRCAMKQFNLAIREKWNVIILGLKNIDKILLLLCLILVIAAFVRLWGVNYGLPYIYHADEPRNIRISHNIFKTGDLNPHAFAYGSLFFYSNALVLIPYYISGRVFGVFTSRTDILSPVSLVQGATKSLLPSTVLLGRILTIIFSLGTVLLTFLIGKQLTGKASVGLFASFIMAISPSNVFNSRFITTDTLVVFFVALSFFFIVLIYQQGRMRYYIIAGLCIGLTVSCKYNGGLIILPLIFAYILHNRKQLLKNMDDLYLALQLCGIGFIATTPFALLDWSNFFAEFTREAKHYSTQGHIGMDGDSMKWYLNYMWETAGIVYIMAVIEIFRGLYSRSKEIILLSVFPVIYVIFIFGIVVRNDRTFIPVTPFLFVLAASFLINLINNINKLQSKIVKDYLTSAAICLSIICIYQPNTKTIQDMISYTKIDNRELARLWINNNLPSRSKIAIESNTPFINPTKFYLHGISQLMVHEPNWYKDQKFSYIIFNKSIYQRYYKEPERSRAEIATYNNLFKQVFC